MSDVPSMVSASVQLLETLRALEATVTEQWPRREPNGAMIVLQETGNSGTANPLVDTLSYQIDIWAGDADTVRGLVIQADALVTGIGFRRTLLSPLTVDSFGNRQSARYSRNVDKRTLRLVD